MNIILIVLMHIVHINVYGLDEFSNTFYMKKNLLSKQISKQLMSKRVHKTDTQKHEVSKQHRTIVLWHEPPAPVLKMFHSRINTCAVKNCVLLQQTQANKDKITEYDAIIFAESNKESPVDTRIPKMRSIKQKYIYLFTESTSNYGITKAYNDIFNWVMSYRLTSDIVIPYISIYDKAGAFVGPKINMTWIKYMKDISPDLKKKLKLKTKLGAIFVSNCLPQKRLSVVKKMNQQLRKYNLNIDVFGACGDKKCPKNVSDSCDAMLERNYFFYLSFENSFAVDYVTEKLTRAVHTHTVPVVLGGADYSRFMPPGSYINACDRDPAELAETLVDVMSNRTRYYEYFRFTNHYHYYNSDYDSRFVCDICQMLNNEILSNNHSRHANLFEWYNQDIRMSCRQ